MEVITQFHQIAAVLIARLFLGCLFFFQGFDAVFKVKIQNIIQTYQRPFSNSGIPKFLTIFAAWFTSYSALIGGTLLIFGFFEYCALILLGINLIITTIGFSINTPMWDTRFVFPRLIVLVFLLLVPETWNMWSLDHLLISK